MILRKKVFSFPVQFLTLLQYVSRKLTSKRCFDKKMGVKNKTCFLGWRKFPTHRLLLLSFPLLKIQWQEKRKTIDWSKEEGPEIIQLLDRLEEVTSRLTSRWQESKGSFVLSQYLFSTLYTPQIISLKFVFNEKPPLLNITLSQVNLSNLWDCLARTNFEHNWKNCWVVLLLTSVILCSIVWTFMLLILL